MKNLEAYILHYTPLKERKKFILENLKSSLLNLNFIEAFDKEDLNYKMIQKNYENNHEKWKQKTKIYNNDVGLEPPPFRELTKAEISLIQKHKTALEIISDSENKIGLILEDDIIPVNNYEKKIYNIIQNYTEWDVLFIGLGIGKKYIRKKLNKKFLIPGKIYNLPTPSTNCTEAILFKKDIANIIVRNFQSFSLPMDYEYAYLFSELNLDVKITGSPIFYQGSKTYGYNKRSKYEESVRK